MASLSSSRSVRVTTLELFFDLVFVFTITQLTFGARRGPRPERRIALALVAVMLALIFYMYDGYAWLTNAVPDRAAALARLLLLGGMAGFLMIALAVPHAYERDRPDLRPRLPRRRPSLHAGMFIRASSADELRAILAAGAVRTCSAPPWSSLGGAIGGDAQTIIWARRRPSCCG